MKKILLFFIALSFITFQTHSQELWGMTLNGGTDDIGTIFKTDLDGSNLTTVHSFEQDYDGQRPMFFQKLCEASNGKLYGTTREGGLYSNGIIFEFDPSNNTYTKKIEFDDNLVPGKGLYGGLIQATNGKLYGLTRNGGASNGGTLYEYDVDTNTLTKKLDFTLSSGSNLQGDLLQATNGKLYGVASTGGAGGAGVLFEYDIVTDTRTYSVDFYQTPHGRTPNGSLVQASNGKLYGTTNTGGANNYGVLFEYDITNRILTNKFNFNNANNGGKPWGGLEIGANGLLYGLASSGGANGNGVLFEFNWDTGVFTNKHDFETSTGGGPTGALELASNGKLYGSASNGGTNSRGVLFEYDTSTDSYSKKYDFDTTDGTQPFSMQQIANGKLYGLTTNGGANNVGVLFEFDINNSFTYTKKYSFTEVYKGNNPYGDLLLADNGKLYGMTFGGGLTALDGGTLFELDTITEEITTLYNFFNFNGLWPSGSLIQASDGLLYGLTRTAGADGIGVIFSYDLTKTGFAAFTKLYDFSSSLGAQPFGSLVEASNGNLYGMTQKGGLNNFGTLFEFRKSDGVLTRKVSFSTTDTKGYKPEGSLIEAADGNLYGMARSGGANSGGTMFKYVPGATSITVLIDFGGTETGRTNSEGTFPLGSMFEASNGKLYGLTETGGANGLGILFEYAIGTDTYTKKIDFDGVNNGSNPRGSLSQSSNGKLIGTTYTGGVNDLGVLFEYDFVTNTLTKKFDFDGINGQNPYSGSITDISSVLGVEDFKSQFNFLLYPNPTKGNVTISLTSSASYSLVNMLGQEIQKGTFIFGDNTLDVSKLSKGLYLLNVKTSQGSATKKIIKQ